MKIEDGVPKLKKNISNYLVHIQKLNGTETSTETY